MTTTESVVRSHALPPSSTDRREHDRAPLSSPVLLDTLDQWRRARCVNVSVGGVAVADVEGLAVGRTVEVYFELPNGVAVETRALVVRSDHDSAGLSFLFLDPRAERALREHCAGDRR